MEYKTYIKRKLGSLINKRDNEYLKSVYAYRFRGMTDIKEKEIIVYLRNQKGMDKQQLIDFIKEKFDLNDIEAERLFDSAYPDGLDLEEEDLLDNLNNYLKESSSITKKAIDNIFDSLLNKTNLEVKSFDPILFNTTKIVISSLLQRRKLI
ncbi:MAG: hypothetical protein WC554_19750 [Clostridia bacterium]